MVLSSTTPSLRGTVDFLGLLLFSGPVVLSRTPMFPKEPTCMKAPVFRRVRETCSWRSMTLCCSSLSCFFRVISGSGPSDHHGSLSSSLIVSAICLVRDSSTLEGMDIIGHHFHGGCTDSRNILDLFQKINACGFPVCLVGLLSVST